MAITVDCPARAGGGRVTFQGSSVPNQSQVLDRCLSRTGASGSGGKEMAKAVKNTSVEAPKAESFIGKIGKIAGGIAGAVPGLGGVGEAIEGISGLFGGGGRGARTFAGGGGAQECPPNRIRVGNRCIAPGDAFPGGSPFSTPAGGRTVEGSFGLPAVTPVQENHTRLNCPEGMVLGKDDLCYPRQILGRRNRFRKWRQPPRPPVSAADAKALRKVDKIRGKVRDLGKKADLKVTKR